MKLAYRHIVAILFTAALFLDRADLTIVNISLATLAHHFQVPIAQTDWVNLSFLLALSIAIPISIWLGGRFGLKRIFVISLMLFGVGSTLCAFAPTLNILIIFRFIHGIGGGMLIPVGTSLLYRVFDKNEYASITSYVFLPSLVAPAIAPFFGGVLLKIWSWHAIFLVTGPIALILGLLAMIKMHEDNYHSESPLDVSGFILASFLLIDLFYLFSSVAENPESKTFIIMAILLIPTFIYFIRCEKSKSYPLIDLAYFKNKMFVKSNLAQLCFQSCHFGAIFLVSIYLQIGAKLSAIQAGLIMGMQAIGAMCTSRLAVHLFNYHSPRKPTIIGFIGLAIISPCTLFIGSPTWIYFGLILFFIRGLFSGLIGVPIQTLSVIGFDKYDLAPVSTVFNACRQISISFGVALSSIAISLSQYYYGISNTNNLSINQSYRLFSAGFIIISALSILGIFTIFNIKKTSSVANAK